ncbi:ATP-binding cassette, subfamily C, CydD [Pilibacter termitis]|uniref:ATP-binding cassette, subfamily C, CydD n=1 Tax=Pilibacter termitis TaxID=263852 RepID=A0A1T4MG40_9ENTE|nr:thiol reductant ABC exporter subunit CydD [Pilibacter termitis]SJZ65902.1 ATP-binding cassette, subfamily C, CydD [Pilibacter termitis]
MIEKTLFRLPNVKNILMRLSLLAVLQAFFVALQGWFLASAITHVWQGEKLSSQVKNIALFLLFYTLRHIATYVREQMLDVYAYEQAKIMRERLVQKLFENPFLVQQQGSGNATTMVLDGISEVENYIQLTFSKLLNMAIFPLIILGFVFYLDKTSALSLLLVFPIIIVFMIVLGKAAQAKASSQYKNFQILSNHFIDSLRGLKTLKLFGLSKSYTNAIYQTSERFRKSTMATLRIAILSTFALDFFTTLSVAIVATFLGIRLINGELTLFPALTCLILAPEYFLPLRDFAGDYHATLNGKNAFVEIQNVLNQEETLLGEEEFFSSWNEESSLSISNLNFSYEELPTIDTVDFQWQGYGKIGIIGASGAGKSTLIQLLAGFLTANSGEISLNDTKLQHLKQQAWQKNLSFIPQASFLFSGTLRENLTLYTPEASEEDIVHAVKLSGLTSFLESLPEGLNTQIGQGAREVSGGQAQRIALARAFLSEERRILLLDEPTAHLDIATEMEIKNAILPLFENRLVFLATHRLHWMPQMDAILVLKNGKVAGFGTHEKLLSENEVYRSLIGELRG